MNTASAVLPLLLSVSAGLTVYAAVVRLLRRFSKIGRRSVDAHILPHIASPLRWPIRVMAFDAPSNWRAYRLIAIWDQRRMMVPLSYFIEKPFRTACILPASSWAR